MLCRKNEDHQRIIAACLVKSVYILEQDREGNREGSEALAPPWWESFGFKLIYELIDVDSSIFCAIFEIDNLQAPEESSSVPMSREMPRYVVAFRGTILKGDASEEDIRLNVKIVLHLFQRTPRVKLATKTIKELVDAVGSSGLDPTSSIWLAGHSQGAATAMHVGKKLAKKGTLLKTFLFNPPFPSLPILSIKVHITHSTSIKKIKDGFTTKETDESKVTDIMKPIEKINEEVIIECLEVSEEENTEHTEKINDVTEESEGEITVRIEKIKGESNTECTDSDDDESNDETTTEFTEVYEDETATICTEETENIKSENSIECTEESEGKITKHIEGEDKKQKNKPPFKKIMGKIIRRGKKFVDKRIEGGKKLLDKAIDGGKAATDKVAGVLAKKQSKNVSEDPIVALSPWLPSLFVNPADYICSEYIDYFKSREEKEKKLEDNIKEGSLKRSTTVHTPASLLISALAKKPVELLHLIPSATVTVNFSHSKKFLDAHGLSQWWSSDLELHTTPYKYTKEPDSVSQTS